MRQRTFWLALALGLALTPRQARAQGFQLGPYFGWTSAGGLERTARVIDELEIGGGFTWGAQFGYFWSPNIGIEASWARQETHLGLETASRRARLFEMRATQLHGNFVYQFGRREASQRPYLLAGMGVTILSSSEHLTETKFSWAVGGGLKLMMADSVGLKFQGKYNPTSLNDESAGDFCDPFGFCSGTLSQFELGAGVLFRF